MMIQYYSLNTNPAVGDALAKYGKSTKEILDSLDYDTLWKAIGEYFPDLLIQYFLPEMSKDLDFSKMAFMNKEQEQLLKEKLGLKEGRKYVDKLIQIHHLSDPDKKLRTLIEFQTTADGHFTERTASYINILHVDNKDNLFTMAIISRARKSYSNEYVMSFENNGITAKFADHIIYNNPGALYEKPDCLVSQLLHAIWLKEHFKDFSQEILEKKYLIIAKNIIKFDLEKDKYIVSLLFIQKYAQKCLSDPNRFDNFVTKLFNMNPKLKEMDIFETLKEQGIAEGVEKGIAEGKAQVIIGLAKESKMSLQQIAKIARISVRQVKSILAAL